MSDDADDGRVRHPEPDPEGFGRKGWVLVAAVVASVLVVPGAVYLFPAVPAEAGVPFFVAMLVLPLVPAVVLGLVAVWSMTAGTAGPDDD